MNKKQFFFCTGHMKIIKEREKKSIIFCLNIFKSHVLLCDIMLFNG
jgi:hypothetical protein